MKTHIQSICHISTAICDIQINFIFAKLRPVVRVVKKCIHKQIDLMNCSFPDMKVAS
jgi:hypothetical protein